MSVSFCSVLLIPSSFLRTDSTSSALLSLLTDASAGLFVEGAGCSLVRVSAFSAEDVSDDNSSAFNVSFSSSFP
jgi:hypothetical protein